MYVVNSYVSFAIYLAVFLVVTLVAFQWQQSRAVRRRILRMMLTFGIDEETARNAEALLDIDMSAVRRRCRRCPSPDACERWLDGKAVPGNDFCPNAPEFAAVAQPRLCRVRWDPATGPAVAWMAESYSVVTLASSSRTG